MKTYFLVISKFFDNGKVKGELQEIQAFEKPASSYDKKEEYDEYKDYFEKKSEAMWLLNDLKYA